MKRGVMHDNDVLLYKDEANLGRKSLFRDRFPHEHFCANEHVFILRPNKKCSQSYLYFWLNLPKVTQSIVNFPGLSQNKVKSLSILIQDIDNLNESDQRIELVLALLFNLAKRIKC